MNVRTFEALCTRLARATGSGTPLTAAGEPPEKPNCPYMRKRWVMETLWQMAAAPRDRPLSGSKVPFERSQEQSLSKPQ
jgi:hypothetical protein